MNSQSHSCHNYSAGQASLQTVQRRPRIRSNVQCLVIQARGGRGSGDSKLIIPGGSEKYQRNKQPSRLVLPGQERASKGASIDTSGVSAPSTTQFRPPPGFMDLDPHTQAAQPLDQEEARNALDRLRSSAGDWHELAQLIPRLSVAGYDSTVVEMETGLERATQSNWTVSAQVYESLKKSEKVSEETLSYFGSDASGADMLYHLRFLPVGARPAVAKYIVDRQFSAIECSVLARAVKEQERRSGDKEGFTSSPADCLAYKYYRDAIESRKEHERTDLIQKGLAVAESSEASAALEKLLAGSVEPVVGTAEAAQQASLEVIRLTGEEVEFRPVPLVGELAEASPSAVAAAVGVQQAGPYNAFHIPSGTEGHQFVALPAFRSLLLSRSPVALSVADCSTVPLLTKAANLTGKADEQRHAGPGLILLERLAVQANPEPNAFYVRGKGQHCELIEGNGLSADEEVLGRVLFLCRPPARTASAKLNTSALMSV